MTHVETAGTFSCSHISIGWFKNQRTQNEKYKKDKIKTVKPADGLDCNEFYTKILYPVIQQQGKTYDMTLAELMEQIDDSPLKTKMITAMLNSTQFFESNHYWPKELKEYGFKLVKKTKNSIGGAVNYLFVRNPNDVPIKKEEEEWM